MARTILMLKSETKNPFWLRLPGYHVVSLKTEFDEHAVELERALREGVPVYPDAARANFYDVMLAEGWAYIHVYPDGRTVYLVAHSLVRFGSFEYCYGKTE